ncbi:class I SAM-dependent methyltransferase [Thermomonospora cellulosilytica]|uniref:Ubiquinone/menaquinone biosynthesis C-methylase UbiE n=1 Tax=Thermomonospora cellulosilytica TaxID=1411118 RepID=A0A7W3MYQ0_9ACTN|nr:methyltransferase domain-containing protein [Thermomonospora cellulosilytica]MBA9004340.1 ubiquinone/menaquinone biosynthesis C-methylase UbiE [Thermomonospora cellulosilytica]
MTTPQDMKAAIAGIFDRSAASYERTGPEFFAPMGRELARRAAPRKGERVLDVGCGRGHCLFPLAEAVGPEGEVLGLDLAPGMVEATAAEARARGLDQVTVRIGDAADPGVEPGSFDLVTAGFVIFFLPDPAAGVAAWARALRAGGRLAISTFAAQGVHERVMKAIGPFVPKEEGGGPKRPVEMFRSAEAVTAVLGEGGFTDVEHRNVTFETRFTGPDQWWEWIGSHGGRGTLERLPEDRVEDARAAAYEVMETARTPDGALVLHTEARFTTARLG